MTPLAASVLALLAVAAAIECPDETWLKLNGKCYSKQAPGTHAECGANASLVHITSQLENDFAAFVAAENEAWIGFYKIMHPLHPHDAGMWGRWTSSEAVAYTNWIAGEPGDDSAAQGTAPWSIVVSGGTLRARRSTRVCAGRTRPRPRWSTWKPRRCSRARTSADARTSAVFLCALVLVEILHASRGDPERSQQKISQQNNINRRFKTTARTTPRPSR